jgi:hypothetical protein
MDDGRSQRAAGIRPCHPRGRLGHDAFTYAYDANGNKAQDVAKKMNADNNAAYLESTRTTPTTRWTG